MKKLVAISVVAGLMISLASAAMATGTATDWTILLKGSDTAYSSAAGLIQVGTATGASDLKDTKDAKYSANFGNQAQVAAWETDPSFNDSPQYYSKDFKAPITTAAKSWTLLFWVGTGYTGSTARLAWWSTSTLTPIATAANWTYTIKVESDPTGTYAAGTTWEFTPSATGASTTPVGFKDFSNLGNIKLADASATAGVKLTLTAGPSAPVLTPEPSSMLALASGLFGLAGFSIRRRK